MPEPITLYDEILADLERAEETVQRLGDLLEQAVNVMRGAPPPDVAWSTRDVAELATLYRNVYVDAIQFIALGGWQGERGTPQFRAFHALAQSTVAISDNVQRDFEIIRDALAERKAAGK